MNQYRLSISDDIKYSANDRKVSDKEVVEAVTAASINL
jgi:hypothetical protein